MKLKRELREGGLRLEYVDKKLEQKNTIVKIVGRIFIDTIYLVFNMEKNFYLLRIQENKYI